MLPSNNTGVPSQLSLADPLPDLEKNIKFKVMLETPEAIAQLSPGNESFPPPTT